ncbi:zinc finger protein CONSTANS-LIKE 2-like [Phoenix dactylifera]|uniref:Zinc finger protein CONSTANS-LIKE 2-like n=1 Tax=Phoenix dactylifera TaxID=42345 RepID=A0A8B9A135_PHODC|nr:zinc finger protein CONSTANS-LIKE 2-like [Phoenix dactylifera]
MPCDYCSEAAAVLYCRADDARLCLSCDRQVHAANALARKHVRSLACDKRDSILPGSGIAGALRACAPEIHAGPKRQKSPVGKQALFQQLTELVKMDSAAASRPPDLSPRTPCRTVAGGSEDDRGSSQPMPYTSLLMLAPSGCAELKGSDRLVEDEDLLWDCGPTDHSTQVL